MAWRPVARPIFECSASRTELNRRIAAPLVVLIALLSPILKVLTRHLVPSDLILLLLPAFCLWSLVNEIKNRVQGIGLRLLPDRLEIEQHGRLQTVLLSEIESVSQTRRENWAVGCFGVVRNDGSRINLPAMEGTGRLAGELARLAGVENDFRNPDIDSKLSITFSLRPPR